VERRSAATDGTLLQLSFTLVGKKPGNVPPVGRLFVTRFLFPKASQTPHLTLPDYPLPYGCG
jgi:hypothetical protein